MKQVGRIIWLVLLLETLLFVTFYYREIAWYPPAIFDQGEYLARSYALQESATRNGLQELLRPFIESGHETGIAFPVEGALFGLFLGIPRLSRLCVGFAAFAVLQICAYSTARKLWDGCAYGFAALGLVLCQSTLWFWAGGLFDYRMDFLAYCVYGIWACLVLRSGLFDDRKWAVASALVGVVLVLNRFLTIVYLSGVLLGFATALAVLWIFLGKSDAPELDLKNRLRNLAISLIVLFCGTIPFMVLNAKAFHEHYVVGTLTSDEKYIRAQEFGLTSVVDHLLYYPKSVLSDHLGPMFIAGALIAIFAGIFSFFTGRPRKVAPTFVRARNTQILQGIYLLGAIAGPLVVLTCDVSKSPVVGGIVGVPCALLVVWLMAALAFGAGEADLLLQRRVLGICAGVVVGLGVFNQLAHASKHLPSYDDRESYERLTELDRWLAETARKSGLSNPTISADIVSQWLTAQTITASAFEQTGKLVPFRQLLGRTIFGVERDEALSELANSDYVVLTTVPKVGVYPFYEKIQKYWNDLKSWSDENMLLVQTMPFEDYTATIYVRPIPRILGVSGDWITSRGLDLETKTGILEKFPVIRLAGTTNFSHLPKVPSVSVTVQANNKSMTLPATLMRDGRNYTISFDTSSLGNPRDEHVRFHVSFDVFFIPKVIGINEDTRELVIRAPSRVEMQKKSRDK
jgi:hypothetical protein